MRRAVSGWFVSGVAAVLVVACSSSSSDSATAPETNDDSGAGTGNDAQATNANDAGKQADSGEATKQDGGTITTADGRAPLWVYYDGAFNWPSGNDYSYALDSISYADKTATPLSGSLDIKITSAAFGGWQPAAGVPLTPNNWDQDITGMGHFTFSLKPTTAGMSWKLFFHKVGDVLVYDSTGNGLTVVVNTAKYGPVNPPANEWSTYVVPVEDVLTDYDNGGTPGQGPPVLLTHVYKFAIADSTGDTQTWLVDNVGFIP